MPKTILVTGGAGYIGSHTCKALAALGYTPVSFDNLSTGHRHAVKWGPLVEGDITDPDALRVALEKYDVGAVIHFAALALVGESVERPDLYYQVNVVGTFNVLEAMRLRGVRDFVLSSSCATYGCPDRSPIAEDTPQQPINPYGATKLAGERMALDYAQAFGMRVALLRYFNAAGADADLETGEDRAVETHLIPRAMLSALGRLDDFAVFGSDFPTRDGTAVRDYVHVSDLADAHILALQALAAHAEPLVANIGTGAGYTVLEVLRAIERVTGHRFADVKGPRRPGDPPELVADPAKARRVLKFEAKRSDLDSIVSSAWNWHRKTHA